MNEEITIGYFEFAFLAEIEHINFEAAKNQESMKFIEFDSSLLISKSHTAIKQLLECSAVSEFHNALDSKQDPSVAMENFIIQQNNKSKDLLLNYVNRAQEVYNFLL